MSDYKELCESIRAMEEHNEWSRMGDLAVEAANAALQAKADQLLDWVKQCVVQMDWATESRGHTDFRDVSLDVPKREYA